MYLSTKIFRFFFFPCPFRISLVFFSRRQKARGGILASFSGLELGSQGVKFENRRKRTGLHRILNQLARINWTGRENWGGGSTEWRLGGGWGVARWQRGWRAGSEPDKQRGVCALASGLDLAPRTPGLRNGCRSDVGRASEAPPMAS